MFNSEWSKAKKLIKKEIFTPRQLRDELMLNIVGYVLLGMSILLLFIGSKVETVQVSLPITLPMAVLAMAVFVLIMLITSNLIERTYILYIARTLLKAEDNNKEEENGTGPSSCEEDKGAEDGVQGEPSARVTNKNSKPK